MDIRQLRYFYTIATEGQITRAANKLHMAQPPLSQSLKSLEKEVGVPLLERNGRKMELTDAGRVLYDKANHLFHYLDETLIEVKEVGEGLKGKLSIGCVKSAFSYMPKRMKAFREQYPDVTFELREGDSYLLAEQLKNRDLDLAIIRLPLELEPFSSHSLPEEDYVAIIPERWAEGWSGSTILMKDLAKLPLLLLRRISGVGQYELILDKFNEYGVEPNIVTECPDVDMILELVSKEVGVSIIPESTLSKSNIGEVKKLTIEDGQIISRSSVIWLKNRYLSKSAEHFIKLFQDGEQFV